MDFGWYPEFNSSGSLFISLIKNNIWENPVVKRKVNNLEELEKIIKDIEQIVGV